MHHIIKTTSVIIKGAASHPGMELTSFIFHQQKKNRLIALEAIFLIAVNYKSGPAF